MACASNICPFFGHKYPRIVLWKKRPNWSSFRDIHYLYNIHFITLSEYLQSCNYCCLLVRTTIHTSLI